jgi:hypothetical protein
MLKEEKIMQEEFFNIFPELDSVWFYRFIKVILKDYYILPKNVLLQTIDQLRLDCTTEYTVLYPKPGDFKTSRQEEGRDDFIDELSISKFRDPYQGYNDISYYKFLAPCRDERYSDYKDFLDKYFYSLKALIDYNNKEISLKEFRTIYNDN